MSIKLSKDYSLDNDDKDNKKNTEDKINHNQTIEDLLRKNLELTEKVYKMTKSVKSYVFWARIGGYLKIALIVLPLIAGYIYLAPILNKAYKQYQSIVGIGTSTNNLLKSNPGGQTSIDTSKLDIDSLKSMFNK